MSSTPAALPPDGPGPARSDDRLTPLREMQLLEAHRAGDSAALAALLRGYQRRIYAVCRRMVRGREEAADLTQDSLIKVLEGLDSYDGRSALSTWIIRVTMNCCLSHLRKEKLRRHGSIDDPGREDGGGPMAARIVDQGEPSVERGVERNELRSALLAALGDIDPVMRSVLVLRDLQDLEYQEIGIVLDVPVGTVKSRLFRARAALREAVERRTGTDGDEIPDTAVE